MPYVRETAIVGGKEIVVETGKWAKQAGGSVVIRCGESMVLVAASGSQSPREIDFMPLTCEYQEKFYSSGKIPGSYFRREARPTNEETLVCRLMDRPVRPLFPKGWFIDTQIIANVISFDKVHPSDVLAMSGASAAIHISDLVWDGPLAGIRVGYVDGKLVANPTFAERKKSTMDMIVACTKDAIMMVEGEMHEVGESLIIAGSRNGYFTDQEHHDVVSDVKRSGADLLFIGMPSPFKEVFAADHLDEFGADLVMGVGGSFDVISGFVPRAPSMLQRTGFDAAVLRADQDSEAAQRALRFFAGHYQGDVVTPAPRFHREAA